MLRALSIVAGVLIIGAVTHLVILNAGGYSIVTAPVPVTAALGLVIGSAIVGRCLHDRRRALAVFLSVALFAGELYAMIVTCKAVVTADDATSRPVIEAQRIRTKAETRVADAVKERDAADLAVMQEAPLPGCKRECAKLLTDAKDRTARELADARAALEILPPPKSANPLADHLHVDGSSLDLIEGVLRALGLNGLAACLIAYGADGKQTKPTPRPKEEAPAIALPVAATGDHVAMFMLRRLKRADGARTSVASIYDAFGEWCGEQQPEVEAMPAREFDETFKAWCERGKVSVRNSRGKPVLHNIALTDDAKLLTA